MSEDRPICLRLSYFEAGILSGIIGSHPDRDGTLRDVFEQLIDIKKQIEVAAGVTKELLPNGLLKIADTNGNVIIRVPHDWELGEKTK